MANTYQVVEINKYKTADAVEVIRYYILANGVYEVYIDMTKFHKVIDCTFKKDSEACEELQNFVLNHLTINRI